MGLAQSAINVPFTAQASNFKPPHTSYWSMILDLVCPQLTMSSLSFLLLIIITLCLLAPQLIWQPHDYVHFLTYTGIPYVYLDSILVRLNHKFIYQTFTSIFFHLNLIHWFNSAFMLLLLLPATNLYVTIIFEGIFMGLSGVLAAGLGIYIAYLIANWDYLMANYYETVFRSWIFALFFMVFMLLSDNHKTTSLHFIGLGLGVLIGMGFLPRHVNN
jgi:hypothetical protein